MPIPFLLATYDDPAIKCLADLFPRAVVTPHIAGLTVHAKEALAHTTLQVCLDLSIFRIL